tara:strand:- start:297 stop:623 length:327 start_codon:yes stop_codon:yes gene_type:complete
MYKHLTPVNFSEALELTEHDKMDIHDLYECVLKIMELENMSLDDCVDILIKEQSYLRYTNQDYLSKVISCVSFWMVYILLKDIEPIQYEMIMEAKEGAFRVWNELSMS